MAVQVTGSKTVTWDVSPNATAAELTAVLATVDNLTDSQLQMLEDTVRKVPGGHAPGVTISSLLR